MRNQFICLILFTGSLATIADESVLGQKQATPEVSKDKFHLFLLVGQSNMAGRGIVERQDREPHPRVLMLTKDNRWAPAVDPLHFDKASVGVGIGKTFGTHIAETDPEITVGLIPCAAGGSPISSWEPGGYHAQTKSHPYDDAIKRAKIALESGTLKGILWHQGESDSKPGRAEVYEEKLHALVARVRKEFDAPTVPFIAGQMGIFAERLWSVEKKQVDAVHRNLPKKVAHTAFVDAVGLKHKGDQVHFDAKSYRQLGSRYAHAYQAMTNKEELTFQVERTVAARGFDGTMCWVHARAGAIPPKSTGRSSDNPTVVMTTQKLLLSGSDVFYALNEMRTSDLGQTWSEPVRHKSFARKKRDDDIETTVCDFTPKWHAASGKLLGTGHTVWYQNNRVMHVRPRATAYAAYDPKVNSWSSWKELKMPDEPKFENAGAGSVQRLDLAGGDILLPIYFKEPKARQYSTTVCRCRFDGETLTYIEHGSELSVNVKRGLYEPSITKFGERFFLTMRNDDHGYISVSDDGSSFSKPKRWVFDDGSDLGNYNTQQHWVTHNDGLLLVYTRRGADNDHVFRHRAPLFIARVDPEKLQVIRATERILVPERGARLGNFAVANVSSNETWVTVTEWMQPKGVEKYGSDNSIFVVRLKWNRPNGLVRVE